MAAQAAQISMLGRQVGRTESGRIEVVGFCELPRGRH